MPKRGKIYYLSPIPMDLLTLIGQFAGDLNRPLKFTLTPRKKYLGTIFVITPYKRYKLRKESWIPRRLGSQSDAARVQQYLYDKLKHSTFFLTDINYLKDLDCVLGSFLQQLTGIRNYSLKWTMEQIPSDIINIIIKYLDPLFWYRKKGGLVRWDLQGLLEAVI